MIYSRLINVLPPGQLDAFLLGRALALRDEWLDKARREASCPAVTAQRVKFAREYHREALQRARRIRRSDQPDAGSA